MVLVNIMRTPIFEQLFACVVEVEPFGDLKLVLLCPLFRLKKFAVKYIVLVSELTLFFRSAQ